MGGVNKFVQLCVGCVQVGQGKLRGEELLRLRRILVLVGRACSRGEKGQLV